MTKIGTFIEQTNKLLGKEAFVPASAIQGPQGPQGQPGPQGPQGGGSPVDALMAQLGNLPPEEQQQLQPIIEQISQLPPEQQQQAVDQIMAEMGGGAPGDPNSGAQMPPEGGDPNGGAGPQGSGPGEVNTDGHVQAENQLDNIRVSLTVRELLDLTSGGTATKSLLAVKQLAEQHNQKMQQAQAKAEQQKAQSEAEAQAANAQNAGGIYSAPPDMSGKMAPPQ